MPPIAIGDVFLINGQNMQRVFPIYHKAHKTRRLFNDAGGASGILDPYL